jgi:hypothetical protein
MFKKAYVLQYVNFWADDWADGWANDWADDNNRLKVLFNYFAKEASALVDLVRFPARLRRSRTRTLSLVNIMKTHLSQSWLFRNRIWRKRISKLGKSLPKQIFADSAVDVLKVRIIFMGWKLPLASWQLSY